MTARRMSFFSDTVAHSALAGGRGPDSRSGGTPSWPMVGVSLLVGLLILAWEHTELLTDTIMLLDVRIHGCRCWSDSVCPGVSVGNCIAIYSRYPEC